MAGRKARLLRQAFLLGGQPRSRLESIIGLQSWNARRALDFLASLPDVDPFAPAVSGANGGGTQTFIRRASTIVR